MTQTRTPISYFVITPSRPLLFDKQSTNEVSEVSLGMETIESSIYSLLDTTRNVPTKTYRSQYFEIKKGGLNEEIIKHKSDMGYRCGFDVSVGPEKCCRESSSNETQNNGIVEGVGKRGEVSVTFGENGKENLLMSTPDPPEGRSLKERVG